MTAIRVTLLQDDQLRQGGEELIDAWRAESDDKLWVDIAAPEHEILEPLLETRFGFHELAAEDSLSTNTLPKYDHRCPQCGAGALRVIGAVPAERPPPAREDSL